MAELTWREQDHYGCEDCGTFPASEALTGEHPFVSGRTVYGCPHCREMDLYRACDRTGCDRAVGCGTPTPDGYRLTCHTHFPEVDRG